MTNRGKHNMFRQGPGSLQFCVSIESNLKLLLFTYVPLSSSLPDAQNIIIKVYLVLSNDKHIHRETGKFSYTHSLLGLCFSVFQVRLLEIKGYYLNIYIFFFIWAISIIANCCSLHVKLRKEKYSFYFSKVLRDAFHVHSHIVIHVSCIFRLQK